MPKILICKMPNCSDNMLDIMPINFIPLKCVLQKDIRSDFTDCVFRKFIGEFRAFENEFYHCYE